MPSTQTTADEQDQVRLLAAWKRGDLRAGDLFYRLCSAPIKHFFRRRVARSDDVADLVQDTFLRCLHADYRGEGSIRAFLFGIAFRVFQEHLRRCLRNAGELSCDEELLERATADFAEDPEYVLEQKMKTRLLMKAIRRIPHRYQLVLELSRWEGLTQAEIAAILSGPSTPIPSSTVGRWKSRAVDLLEAKMLELSNSPDLRKATTMTISAWRRWVLVDVGGLAPEVNPHDCEGQRHDSR